mgnify:FL=1
MWEVDRTTGDAYKYCSIFRVSSEQNGPPNRDLNLMPLYEGGLCEAVIITPAQQLRCKVA